MLTVQTRDAIERVLKTLLKPYDYTGAEISERQDHDGEPAIFILAAFKAPDRLRPPSKVTTDVMVALVDELRALGDERFPYLDYKYPQEPVEDEAA